MMISQQPALEQRVRDFIQDMYEWECFVQKNYNFETGAGRQKIMERFKLMINTYCLPEKQRYTDMSLTSSVHHLPKEEKITSFEATADAATVFTKVKWETGPFIGREEDYEYTFECVDNHWSLDQIYLLAPAGRFECL